MIRRFYGRLPGGPVVQALCTVVVLAVLATGGWFGYGLVFPEDDPSCAAGVERRGPEQECTGVTDGSYPFSADLAGISGKIKQQNDWVDGQIAGKPDERTFVSIAVILPMAPAQQAEQHKTLTQVQGVYLAQYHANHDEHGKQPLIKLLLANPGRSHAHHRAVADQLKEMTRGEERLRAVVGFDVSTGITREAITYLTKDLGIPLVGGPITADDFGNSAAAPDRFPGLVRVVPTTTGEARAIAQLNEGAEPEEGLIVEDIRGDDDYVSALKQAFVPLVQGSRRASEQYRAPDDYHKEGDTARQFQSMVTAICTSPAKNLYFAGRPVQLRQFINELGDRGCSQKNYTVYSGSGASTLVNDKALDWGALRSGITVEYAAVAHPDAWRGANAPASGGSVEDYGDFEKLAVTEGRMRRADLIDSRAITMYDAALTAITSIRGTDSAHPTLRQVADGWLRLHGELGKVKGAGGWICLDNYGNAYNKAVAVVKLDETVAGRVRFLRLGWPEGKPSDKDCTAPR
ncbi:hypothetical protein SRB5_51020 [Streptomyces sp. RB5]|uniref:Leucine-binding protein domain-containing protein n=1 Tax=Streptomyces smaragdinus TaxID=2585196 RepID=A0A7K0CN59_9ACTN|nr:hypothetical protein [Streptomyces smaragdinus]MQY14926.1 hypothetical protein [Streptomyces smaragdinus]